MPEFARELSHITLEEEMQRSYLDYAMSVIVGRALPDVRDGLKPVHRRVLYAMKQLGNEWNKPYKKSARVVGDVIGKYHPHGDAAVYDTIVRMAQPFSMRYLLVDGQGNFGSVDGDAPAAMRYTEVRMAKLAHELLADIDKDTVDFQPNYDGSETEPAVLPTRVPNLLVNGSAGIAVGMATNIPPHNLTETVAAAIALLDEPEIGIDGLMERLPGPDFPTAGILSGRRGILDAYRSGRGRIYLRARAHVEEVRSGREAIVVTELPYQVNKARLIEKIAELAKEKRIEGIATDGLRDESDKEGLRIVIELKRDAMPEVLLNNLYQQTPMQTVFGINMVALLDGQPRLMGLKEMLEAFLRHRREVVTRRTVFELGQARRRAHVLEGLAVALANLDPVIKLIRAAKTPQEAKDGLLARDWEPGAVVGLLERTDAALTRPADAPAESGLHAGRYHLSPTQAQAILDLRLHRLTGLEQDKIVAEYQELIGTIRDLREIIADPERLRSVIRKELEELREQFGDARRTEIADLDVELEDEDLIADEDVVVTLSHRGYVKYQLPDTYQAQRRGGRGKQAAAVKEEDFVEQLFVARTHDWLLCFSNKGKLYWLKVYKLPQAGRGSRGRPIVNLLPLEEDERITGLLPVREFSADHFVFMATRDGTVKKTPLEAFSRPRANGIIALGLRESDELMGAMLTDGRQDLILVASSGRAIRFAESDVRAMGRTAAGVRGIRLGKGHGVIALLRAADGDILIASEHGYGKRTAAADFPRQGRGGQGVIGIRVSERNGNAVGALSVAESDDLILISAGGTLVRIAAAEVSVLGRNTQGVRLIRLGAGDRLVGIARLAAEVDEDEGGEA